MGSAGGPAGETLQVPCFDKYIQVKLLFYSQSTKTDIQNWSSRNRCCKLIPVALVQRILIHNCMVMINKYTWCLMQYTKDTIRNITTADALMLI